MAWIKTQSKFYEEIGRTIRDRTGNDSTYRPDAMAAGIDSVFEAGKRSEYDRFWDEFQQGGARTNYQYAFSGSGWTTQIFKPKYDMVPITANYMFAHGALAGVDLTAHLNCIGIRLDTSRCTSFTQMFRYSSPIRVPELNTVSANTLQQMFYYSSVRTIDKLILRQEGNQTFNQMFQGSDKLEDITIEGVIGQSGFNVQLATKLSSTSIKSIIDALSAATSGLSVIFSKTAVNNAFETAEGASDGSSSEEWAALANTKSNWTINLV